MTGFQLFCVNGDECHMWGRKCSLYGKLHQDFTPFGEFMIPNIYYVYLAEVVSITTMCTDSGLMV